MTCMGRLVQATKNMAATDTIGAFLEAAAARQGESVAVVQTNTLDGANGTVRVAGQGGAVRGGPDVGGRVGKRR